MDVKSILEYQKKDAEKLGLDRKLNSSPNKAGQNKMLEAAKQSQAKSGELDQKAASVIAEIETIKKAGEQNASLLESLMAKKTESLSEEELASISANIQKISQNFAVLDKKLQQDAESVNMIIAEFNKAKEMHQKAKDKYAEYKVLADAELAKIQPEFNKIDAELKAIEAKADKELLAKYKAKRSDRIFPVFVPLDGNSCGGCRMEQSGACISKLKTNKQLECENCRRIIYID